MRPPFLRLAFSSLLVALLLSPLLGAGQVFSQIQPSSVVAIENGWDLEWSSADTLDRYIKQGTVVNVIANGRYNVETVAR